MFYQENKGVNMKSATIIILLILGLLLSQRSFAVQSIPFTRSEPSVTWINLDKARTMMRKSENKLLLTETDYQNLGSIGEYEPYIFINNKYENIYLINEFSEKTQILNNGCDITADLPSPDGKYTILQVKARPKIDTLQNLFEDNAMLPTLVFDKYSIYELPERFSGDICWFGNTGLIAQVQLKEILNKKLMISDIYKELYAIYPDDDLPPFPKDLEKISIDIPITQIAGINLFNFKGDFVKTIPLNIELNKGAFSIENTIDGILLTHTILKDYSDYYTIEKQLEVEYLILENGECSKLLNLPKSDYIRFITTNKFNIDEINYHETIGRITVLNQEMNIPICISGLAIRNKDSIDYDLLEIGEDIKFAGYSSDLNYGYYYWDASDPTGSIMQIRRINLNTGTVDSSWQNEINHNQPINTLQFQSQSERFYTIIENEIRYFDNNWKNNKFGFNEELNYHNQIIPLP